MREDRLCGARRVLDATAPSRSTDNPPSDWRLGAGHTRAEAGHTMPKQLAVLAVLAVVAARSASAANDPAADPKAIVSSGCARFTMLTERLIRMERTATGKFEHRASFAVANRKLPVPIFHVVNTTSGTTTIRTASLELTHRHSASAEDDCSGGFAPGEVTVVLLVESVTGGGPGGPDPPASWVSGHDSPPDMRPSSVARIMPEPHNFNGTMNHGPSFEGGLDCYSNPPDCVAAYHQVWGQGLISGKGLVVINDTNATRLAPAPAPGSKEWQWIDGASTRVANHVDTEDLYLLASGLDYPRALGDWASISGAPSLPPLAALGIWYSRYFPYGEESYSNTIIANYSKYGLPLSVGVLDVPWHNRNYAISDLGPDKKGTAPPGRGCNGWDGFTFNRTLFPDPKRFFDKVHGEGVKMILSVHMQNGIDHCQEQYPAMATAMGYSKERIAANWTINCTMDNSTFVETFFDKIVNGAALKGTADYWWLDYPGGASEVSGWTQQEAASLQWSNRMFAEHKRAMAERPVILARYGGLGQQRDGLGFSGDAFQSYGTLEFQAVMTPTSSNVLFGWWSHDIGGNHNGGYSGYEPVPGTVPKLYPGDENPNNSTASEMLLRWLQFGTFSPILRTHCDPACDRYVWTFYHHFDHMRATMRLRDALVPYIYTAGLSAYRTGVSLLRPMYYSFPSQNAAYDNPSQYMFGDSILVSPVVSHGDNVTHLANKTVWLPHTDGASWLDFVTGALVATVACPQRCGQPNAQRAAQTQWKAEEIPAFVKSVNGAGAIVPMRTMNSTYAAFADPLIWASWLPPALSASASYHLYEDAGDGREYEDASNTAHATTATTLAGAGKTVHFEIKAAVGSYTGQGTSRQQLVQLRGRSAAQIKTVKVNGAAATKTTASAAAAGATGWYVAEQSEDGRDHFVWPVGTVVVAVGRQSIHKPVEVEVECA